MDRTIFIISECVLLISLMMHSYLTRGRRVTFNFFAFAFIMMFNKEFLGTVQYGIPKHYMAFSGGSPAAMGHLTVTFGWMITFYLSWRLSERVLSRFNNFKDRLFATLAFAVIVAMSISYYLENFSATMGLWSWLFYSPIHEPSLLYAPLAAIMGWAHMTFMFLSAFLLMECSKYRRARWKAVFLSIPLAYFLVTPFIGVKIFSGIMSNIIILTVFFSFFSRLRMISELPGPLKLSPYAERAPFIVLTSIMLFVAVYELFVIKMPSLLITTLPISAILLLSVKRIPLLFISAFSLATFMLFKEKAAFSLIPVIFAITLWALNKAENLRLSRGKTYFIIGIIICAFLYGGAARFLNSFYTKLPHFSRIMMSVYKGPTVAISGKAVSSDYREDFASIAVFAAPAERSSPPFMVALKRIEGPGPYRIEVPREIGKVHIMALTPEMEASLLSMPPLDSGVMGRHIQHSLKVGRRDMERVDVEISGAD